MKQLKLSFIILLLFITYNSFAQNIYLPYKVGNKYGLSDTNGNMIVDAKYDFIWPKYRNSDYFTFSYLIDSVQTYKMEYIHSSGIMKDKKELFSGEGFSNFKIKEDYIIGEIRNYRDSRPNKVPIEKNQTALISMSGKDVYPNHFMEILPIERIDYDEKGVYLVFISVNFSETMDLFVYNTKQEEITQWLYKGLKEGEIEFKQESDVYTIKGERKLLQFSRGKFEFYPSKYIPPQIDPQAGIPIITREYGAGISPPMPKADIGSSKTQQSHYAWQIKDEVVYFNRNWIENGKNMNAGIQSELNPDECEINISYRRKENDKTTNNYSNYLIVRSRNKKQAIQLTPELETEAIYDSILAISYTDYSAKDEKQYYYFLVGQKNDDGKMLFGTIDDQLKTILPIKYSFLGFRSKKDLGYHPIKGRRSSIKSAIWLVEDEQNKKGFVRHSGQKITNIIYDSISRVGYNHSFQLYNMRKGKENYGFIFLGDSIVLKPKKLEFELADILDAYADKKKYYVILKERDQFKISCLMDLKGNIFYRKE